MTIAIRILQGFGALVVTLFLVAGMRNQVKASFTDPVPEISLAADVLVAMFMAIGLGVMWGAVL